MGAPPAREAGPTEAWSAKRQGEAQSRSPNLAPAPWHGHTDQIDLAVRAELVRRGLVGEDALTVAVRPGGMPQPHPRRVTVGIEQAQETGDLSVRIDQVVIVPPAPAAPPPAPAVQVNRTAEQTGPSALARFLEVRGGASR